MTTPVVGIDIGGTKTAVALVDRAGRVLERREAPTPARSGPEAVLDVAVRRSRRAVRWPAGRR
ncbi:ROK family protein, partial [Micromonospora zamorensis]|uniref:ROK family protein n=1 Tax=Micromonospora zamorensis TaxID=709883 RepID=UPI0033B94ED8